MRGRRILTTNEIYRTVFVGTWTTVQN